MRVYYILLFLSIWTIKLNAQSLKFKHDWEMKYLEHDIQFTSKKQAPVPFSTTGEPQAIMFVGATKLENSSEKDLPEIVKSEIEDIKKTINIDEYLETDYKAVDNIVSYFDKFVNIEIAIIKYRTFGKKGEQK